MAKPLQTGSEGDFSVRVSSKTFIETYLKQILRNFSYQMKYPSLLTKKISELSPAKYNPRTITSDALGRLTKSLSELGNLQPITWNAKTGNVVGGHQRLKCYSALGKDEIEVWAVWLDETQEKAANLALNKLSGEFDMPQLKDILEELDAGEIDIDITGFSLDEIGKMMEATSPEDEKGGDGEKCLACGKPL